MKKWSLAVAAVALFTSLSMTSAGAMTRLSATQMDRVTAGYGASVWASASGEAVGLLAVSSSSSGSAHSIFFSAAGASNTSFAIEGFAASSASAGAR